MSDYHENGGSGGRTTLIIVGIIGGVVVVFLLVCGGLVFLGIRAMKEIAQPMVEGIKEIAEGQGVANEFLENIRGEHLDWAYESTTESFKKRMTRKGFDELVQKNPELKQPDIRPRHDANQGQNQPPAQVFSGPHRYRYRVQGKDGKEPLEFTITVAKENGVLKVDELTLYKKEGTK